MFRLPHRAVEVFQLTVEAAPPRRLQALLRIAVTPSRRGPSPERRAHAKTVRREDILRRARSRFCAPSRGSLLRSSATSAGWFHIAPLPTRCPPTPRAAAFAAGYKPSKRSTAAVGWTTFCPCWCDPQRDPVAVP